MEVLELGRAAPAASVFDIDELSNAIWLEEVPVIAGRWDLARYSRAARLLGRHATSARVMELLDSVGHTVTIRSYHDGRLSMQVLPVLRDQGIWQQPLVAGAFDEAQDSVHLADFPQADEARLDPDLEVAMAAAQRTVRLGHAARSAAKMKVRQPLRRAVVVANEGERAAIEELSDLVTAELNVHELDFVSEEGELVKYTVKPNYRALGPRFGKRMPQVAAAVAALDPARVASTVAAGGEVGISIDGTDHSLGGDDLTMALAPLEGYEVEAEAGHAVALQLEIDEELRREGLAREIVRTVQNARKEAGLEITDRIALGLGGAAELLDVAREHQSYIAGETLAESVALMANTDGGTVGDGSTGGAGSVATIDGHELRVSVSPV